MYTPILEHKDFRYTRLLAATWHTNLSAPSLCTSAAGARLLDWMKAASVDLPLVLNCAGISTIEDHALSAIETYLTTNESAIAFIVENQNDQLIREIESELRRVKVCSDAVNGAQILIYGSRPRTAALRSMLDRVTREAADLEIEFVKRAVRDSYKDFLLPQRLDSTPLLASGVLNARALISDPAKFTWVSLLLTKLFEQVIEKSRPRTNRILAVSLRGSPFAAAVRLLANGCSPSLEVIDHIGPTHDVLEATVGQRDMYKGEYVLVGDFVIGGTELKVARAYAMSQGAVIKNAIAIGSYLPGNLYDKHIKLESLVNLAAVVPQLKYQFLTDGGQL